MKNSTETINENIFTCFPSARPKNPGSRCGKRGRFVVGLVRQRILGYKNQLLSSIAALGIGTILLLGIYLFLSQLAEYGWR